MFISCPYLPWRYFKVIQGTSHFSFCLHKCRTLFSVNCFCLTLNYNGISFIRDMVRNSATFSLPFWLLNSYRQNPYIGSYRRPFPSSKNSHFQNEAKCKTFVVIISVICMRKKNHLHINGFVLNLALEQRLEATRKWPILGVFEWT